jgi:hypothetical protein
VPLIIPDAVRKADLRFIHEGLAEFKEKGSRESLARAIVRILKDTEFRKSLSTVPKVNGDGDAKNIAWLYLYYHLTKRDYVAASMILWGPKTFTPEPHAAQMMWSALFSYNLINVMGSSSTGKTFAPAAWCLLDWLLDPNWTRVSCISNSEDHCKKNLFADMVRLHGEAVLELPGKVDTESISLDKKRAFGIFVLTVPGGKVSRGKVKGTKIKNRPNHPIFGENSRFRVIIDEAQEAPSNVWDELPNLLASVDGSIEHIKIIAAANPKSEFSPYGQNCKPVGGWDAIRDDTDEWESETGWHVISINALRTENVMAKKTIFPRMITYEGVQKIIKSKAGGDPQHPVCYTFLYGRFPKTSLMGIVIKAEHVRKCHGEWVFDDIPRQLMANDPAFTGDNPAIASGRVGRAIAWVDDKGQRHELSKPEVKIQVDTVGVLQRGDTQEMANENMERCRQLGVRPSGFGIDRTGIGQGIFDIVRRQWRQKVGSIDMGSIETGNIIGIHYSEKPTEVKIAEEDSDTPRDNYDRVATELYFAAAKLIEYDCVRFGKGIDSKTFDELCGRMGGMQVGLGRKLTLEGKDVYKARTGSNSPDRADVVTILIHVARVTTPHLLPKASETQEEISQARNGDWLGFTQQFGTAELAGMGGSGGLPDMARD